ncbi:glycoside hydrolase family 99-like domain-containing protein [Pseudooceanicola nitratireducens]|uniref:glycoside hydrolase family 99-like domain-containing protein n=1 Tax=Pseudooceanicola nitratireducens TaxID=517719 RepID=UPI0023F1442D|nr:glycoside hydrolase family 99-like domain-containing protein [Pseudooceanicola nitratireducens]
MNTARIVRILSLAVQVFLPSVKDMLLMWRIARSGWFDRLYYRNQIRGLHPIWRLVPMRHYLLRGERMGFSPHPEFSPQGYLRFNPDVAAAGLSPLGHFLTLGLAEGRSARSSRASATKVEVSPPHDGRIPRFDPKRRKAPFAIHLHLHYPDLWPEFRDILITLDIQFDLFVTLTWQGKKTDWLADQIVEAIPTAQVFTLPNRGRDILPFVRLINAGALDGYEAVCKLHGKKSLHRNDGDTWRRHLVSGILPNGLATQLDHFLSDSDAAFWVADGQRYAVKTWWGCNREKTKALLRRIEMDLPNDHDFPAGSIYWAKPLMIGMIKALHLDDALFELEEGQIDGTLAHAFERGIGAIAKAAGQTVRQSSELRAKIRPSPRAPRFVSAFYLPQFHPIAENDAWWGPGYTEWSAVTSGTSVFPGHLQPLRPADFGFYDLRLPKTLAAQAALAGRAGIDAFCVYHYWFGGKRLLEEPLDRLLMEPDIDFPFYLCWANESWRRNWDGLSGEVLVAQDYKPDFETDLVASTLPYMRDARYQRPDGRRPRFVVYRPSDLPAPEQNIARMRRAWRRAGIGEVEIGAVAFHITGEAEVAEGLFDFWIEMPPHGLVKNESYVFGGAAGNLMNDASPVPGFSGVIYDYSKIAQHSVDPKYRRTLPSRTIAGIMPSWDNTARRKVRAHIARGGSPATFRKWLREMHETVLETSYRNELFINAWNEWGEKAMLEPSQTFGHLYLDVLTEVTSNKHGASVNPEQVHA